MMKNCVFRAYVTNLGLYNDGYLVGEFDVNSSTSDGIPQLL